LGTGGMISGSCFLGSSFMAFAPGVKAMRLDFFDVLLVEPT
jgi:hypothetical protein